MKPDKTNVRDSKGPACADPRSKSPLPQYTTVVVKVAVRVYFFFRGAGGRGPARGSRV